MRSLQFQTKSFASRTYRIQNRNNYFALYSCLKPKHVLNARMYTFKEATSNNSLSRDALSAKLLRIVLLHFSNLGLVYEDSDFTFSVSESDNF